jgi:hypothetical protein
LPISDGVAFSVDSSLEPAAIADDVFFVEGLVVLNEIDNGFNEGNNRHRNKKAELKVSREKTCEKHDDPGLSLAKIEFVSSEDTEEKS